MATHSSILAWKIPCTEELGGLKESDTTEGLSVHFLKAEGLSTFLASNIH